MVLAACLRANSAEERPVVDWSFADGTPYSDQAYCLAADHAGNLYVAASKGREERYPVVRRSGELYRKSDGVLYKFDPQRKQLWQFRSGGTGSAAFSGVYVTGDSHLLLTGSFQQEIILGEARFRTTNEHGARFVANVSSQGTVQWAQILPGPGPAITAVTTLAETGGFYFASSCPPDATFPGVSRSGNTNHWGAVVKMRADGSVSWAKSFAEGRFYVRKLIADREDSLYASLEAWAPIKLTNGDTVGADGLELAVAKLTSGGDVVWVFRVPCGGGGQRNDAVTDLAVSSTREVVLVGHAGSGTTFGDRRFVTKGQNDVFIAKLNADGKLMWLSQCGGRSHDSASRVVLDAEDSVFVTGGFQDEARFGETALKAESNDMYLTKLDSGGRFVWAQRFGGAGYDLALGLALNGKSGMFVSGWFGRPMELGGVVLRPTLVLPLALMVPGAEVPPEVFPRFLQDAERRMFNADGTPTPRAYSTDLVVFHLGFQSERTAKPDGRKPSESK